MNADTLNADNCIAHRGWQSHYPENTLLAIHGAIVAGARHIEIDIQLSKDGVPILLHNRTLEHMTGNPAAAHDLTLTELQQLNAAEASRFGDSFSGTQLCTLVAVVELINQSPQVHLYVELKRVAIERFGVEKIVDSVLAVIEPIATQCTLISFWLPALTLAKQRGFPRLAPVLIEWSQLQEPELINLSATIIFCDCEKIPNDIQLNTLAWPFALYEIDSPETANYWLARGAAKLETFNIGKFLTTDAINHGQS